MKSPMDMNSVDRMSMSSLHCCYAYNLRIGVSLISFGLPLAVYASTFLCNDISGCPVPSVLSPSTLTIEALKRDVGWPAEGIWGLGSWDVSAKVLGYYMLSLILHRFLPAENVEGTELASGGRLKYRFNSKYIDRFG